MTVRISKKSGLSTTPFVIASQPSPSLRFAFWGLITSSGICWTLALLLGSSLLSSCSGSIFSSGTSTPPPSPPPAGSAPSAGNDINRGLISNPADDLTLDIDAAEGNLTNIDVRDRREDAALSTLSIYEILAPRKTLEWTQNLNENQEADLLSRLSLNIVIGKKSTTKLGSTLRVVNFFIKKDGQNVSANGIPNAPYASVDMIVANDTPKGNNRLFFADGVIYNRDDGSEESISLTLNLVKTKNHYVLGNGSFFINYDEIGDPLPGFRLDGMNLIKLAILD